MGKTCWNLLCNNFFLIFVRALSCPFPLQLRVSVLRGNMEFGYIVIQRRAQFRTHSCHMSMWTAMSFGGNRVTVNNTDTHIIHHKLHLDPSTNPLIHQYTHNLNSSRSIRFAKCRNFTKSNSSFILMRCGIWQSLTRCDNNHTNKM